uniref:CWF19-like protein 2 n=1 Tax=Anabas testudineus TaxID=64144 RepID=A0A7N6ACE8_ANATE
YDSVMAAYGVGFESSSSIEERKESKRQARKEALEKAKKQYEREESRKALKRQRGEDTWMLPEIDQRLQQLEEVSYYFSSLKVEHIIKLIEDEWMTFDFLAMRTTSTAERRAEKERQKEEERSKAEAIEQAGLHKLELNPYWKDGGTGLPPEEIAGTALKKGAVVNDGGLSWLRKSYQRMKEQAEREQRSLNDVVAERYGKDKDRERDRGRNREREKDGGRDRDSERRDEKDRDRDRHRERDRDRGDNEERERPSVAPSLSGHNRSQPSLSLGSLKSRFLKPSEDDNSGEVEAQVLLLGIIFVYMQMHITYTVNNTDNRCVFQLPGCSTEDQDMLLFRTDESGRAWPVKGPSGIQEPHGGRRKKKPIETHVDGERVRYFQDDDNVGLQEMVRREKMSSAQDQNALYSRMAAKMMGKTDGDNYTLDDMFVSSAAQRESEGREEERMRNRAIGESRRLAASMDKCHHCFSSQELQKHLIVAIGSKVYLSLPAGLSMTEGHCLICPLQHHCSATGLDEDVWSEMQLFRRTLVRMFESQELDCVFMETHMNPRRRLHMVLECIPLPRELGDMAPIYFKKALMECDEEWAMNKKIVDLSSKDIRQAVPRGLPYFAVDFGLQGGFAHVIENEQKFPHYFGKEVLGGMMDLEPRRWRKLIRENFDDQRKKVLQFAQWWKPYDCTKTEG